MKTFKKDKLPVEIYENRTLMGEASSSRFNQNDYKN